MRAEWIQKTQLTALKLLGNTQKFILQVKVFATYITAYAMPQYGGTVGEHDPDSEEIPWAVYYHRARELMGMSDSEFWGVTPKKFFALLDESLIFHGIKKPPEPVQFLDDMF